MALFLFMYHLLMGIITVSAALVESGPDRKEDFFSRIEKKGARFSAVPIVETPVRSKLACTILCQSESECGSVNIIRQTNGTWSCEMFVEIPLDPGDLLPDSSSEYWEKTCQLSFGITAAKTVNREGETTIVAEGGRRYYDVQFDNFFHPVDVVKKTSATMTNIDRLLNVEVMPSPNGVLVLNGNEEGLTYCTQNTNPCSTYGPWPKVMQEVAGGHPVWAITRSINVSALLVFSYDKIIEIATVTEPWSVVRVINLTDNSPTNPWKGVPVGVVAASWIKPDLPTRRAFLATRDYFIVFDFTNGLIVNRGHLCKPPN